MKGGYRELDAKSNDVLRRFFDRTGWTPVENEKPGDRVLDRAFADWLKEADDGSGEDVGEYEIRQRMLGARTLFAFIASKGIHPATMLKWFVCVGRGIHAEPFHMLTMHEAGDLMDETAAAHSYRCKVLSGDMELKGFKGSRMPGQKTKASSASYKVCRKGNCNRKGGKKEERRRERKARRLGPAMAD